MSVKFSPKQIETINQPYEGVLFELNEGTPRSGKTTADIFKMAKFYMASPDKNHLVAAYNQEQAFRMFFDGDGFGLMHIFKNCSTLRHDDHGDHLLIYTPSGEEKRIYYKGGGKASSVGSITGISLGTVTFLEYNLLHPEFIQEAFRRTYAAKWRFHLGEQNPPAPDHVNLEFLERFEKTGTLKFRHWTQHDNPVFTPKRLKANEEELKINEYLYKRDWLGQRVMPEGVIYSIFDKDKHFKTAIKGHVIETFYTADAGQADATTCAFWCVSFHEGKHYLYRLANYYHSGRDTQETKAMSQYAKEIKKFIIWCQRTYKLQSFSYFFVDPAAKSLRSELELLGIPTNAADNNSRDKKMSNGLKIEVGIERVQICFDKGLLNLLETESDEYSHYNLIKEFGQYVRQDNGLPIDKYNHACDELRYGVNYFYRKYIY